MQENYIQPQEENMYLVHYDEALGSFVFENNHMSNTEDEAEADLSDWLWLMYDDHRNNSLLTRTNEDEGNTDIDDLFAYLAPYEPQIDMPAAETEHNLEEMSTYARSAENEPESEDPQEHIERMLNQPTEEDQAIQSTQPAIEDQTIQLTQPEIEDQMSQFINPITADLIYEPTFPVVRE